jgi:uncharacterized membrane protein required for colicin V production
VRWPDIVIGLAVLFGLWRGWKRGFIAELTGTLALAAGVAASFAYPGMWDTAVQNRTHLGPGSAHVVAMLGYDALAYGIVFALGHILGGIAKLPLIGTANAALGGLVGAVQACVLLWAVLYVALFFPLSPDLREDLHHSKLVSVLALAYPRLDDTLRSSLPWFVQPFAADIFARHRV